MSDRESARALVEGRGDHYCSGNGRKRSRWRPASDTLLATVPLVHLERGVSMRAAHTTLRRDVCPCGPSLGLSVCVCGSFIQRRAVATRGTRCNEHAGVRQKNKRPPGIYEELRGKKRFAGVSERQNKKPSQGSACRCTLGAHFNWGD